jgi:hypothetical protein
VTRRKRKKKELLFPFDQDTGLVLPGISPQEFPGKPAAQAWTEEGWKATKVAWRRPEPFYAILKYSGHATPAHQAASFMWEDVITGRKYRMGTLEMADCLRQAEFQNSRGALVDGCWIMDFRRGRYTLVHLPNGPEEER